MGTSLQPDYVIQDQKERESFLSQLGTFSPSERELFHKLCKVWTAQISYNYFLSLASSDSATARTDLDNLMLKLKGQRVGIMVTAITEGARTPTHLILRNRDDHELFVYLADEALLDSVADANLPLPSMKSMQERGSPIPPEHAQQVDYKFLARIYNEKSSVERELLRIPGPGNHEFLVVSTSIKKYLTLALGKFQMFFQNANLLAAVAQLKSASLMELRKQLASKDTLFWHDLATFVLSVQKDLMAIRKLTVDPNLFVLCHFLQHFLTEQMAEFKKRKEAEFERQADLKALAEKIRSSLTMMVSEQEFAESLLFYKPKYGDQFNAFKEEFQKGFLEAPLGKNLPVVVRLGSVFIHSDNIHTWFTQNLEKAGRELLAQYVRNMEHYIKRPSDPGFECFYTPTNFDDDIMDRTRSISLPLVELIERPNLVAEAMVSGIRKNKEVRSAEDLRSVLSGLFYTDRIRFKPPSILFGLNILEIYRIAYLKLGIIRQFLLKIGGKHDSFLRKFGSFVIEDGNETMGDAPMVSVPETKASARERYEERRRKELVSGRQKDKKTPGGAWTIASAPVAQQEERPKPKTYSTEERNSAWDNFSKTIKK